MPLFLRVFIRPMADICRGLKHPTKTIATSKKS